MNKKIVLPIILVALIVIEIFVLFSRNSNDTTTNPDISAGTITISNKTVTINEVQIPSYDFQNAVYIAAEDLHNFGFEMIENDDNSISLNYTIGTEVAPSDGIENEYSSLPSDTHLQFFQKGLTFNGKSIQCYTADKYHLIPAKNLKTVSSISETDTSVAFVLGEVSTDTKSATVSNAASAQADDVKQEARVIERSVNEQSTAPAAPAYTVSNNKIIVLDPGHGKSSSAMSKDEKLAEGYVYNESKGQWGEWRHWKSGTSGVSCEGYGCTQTHTNGGSCWYPMGNGDRATEPELNLNNALAAKKYLEQMGYTVRMTRTSNDQNPSFTKRLSYCYPNNDNSQQADALLYMCIHSNAGGGRGSAYISASGPYDQKGISSTYIEDSNRLGSIVNEKIVSTTSMSKCGGGSIGGMGALIAFCKSPVPCGYLEIGFYDNSSDLAILRSESDAIGKAIAEGIDEYVKGL